MAKILVNYPSRSRPGKFMRIIKEYSSLSSGKNEIEYFIKIDSDDVSMNNDRIKKFLNNSGIKYTILLMNDCKGKIDAINRGLGDKQFDVVINIADDMNVITQGWDQILVDDFAGNYDLCLNYNTDKRLNDFKTLLVLPIVGKNLFDRFGYLYHSAYLSEYCDNEQTEVFEKLGKIKHIDRKIFDHDWWNNQDNLMQRNMNVGHNMDKKTFEERKLANFV